MNSLPPSSLICLLIHFLGGIHEIYFPYVLMNPIIIIAPIVGNICAITWFSLTGCGLKGPASPGSIIAFLAMAPKDKILLIALGVLIAAVVQTALQERAKNCAPQAQLVTIGNFLNDPALDALYLQLTTLDAPAEAPTEDAVEEAIDSAEKAVKKDVIVRESIRLNQASVSKEEAIRRAGELLVERGCVEPAYVDAMLDRERLVSTYMGMGVAIPHGTAQAKGTVKKTAITMLQYPEGVDFGDEKAQLVFGIAGIGDEHHLNISCKAAKEKHLQKMSKQGTVLRKKIRGDGSPIGSLVIKIQS